ncbi:hypothetical protein C8Q73DRAFT_479743 [Cubamyces lactineus]|nr:hypothetical protein C8Q73DRAFT_479743 [Cubamyces lactineus]
MVVPQVNSNLRSLATPAFQPRAWLHLLPSDLVVCAKARLFINIFETKVFKPSEAFFLLYTEGSDSGRDLLEGLDALQAALPPSGLAVGGRQWTNADSAVAPFLIRMDMMLKHGIGRYPQSEGLEVRKAWQGQRLARLTKYIADIKESPVYREVWNEETSLELLRRHPLLTQRNSINPPCIWWRPMRIED